MRIKKIIIIIYRKHLNTLFLVSSISAIVLFVSMYIYYNTQNYSYTGYSGINDYALPVSLHPYKPKLAIIIDDFGQNRDGVNEMMGINRHLTFAIMPFLDFSKQDAVKAHEKGYEVIVHLPMQSQKVDIPNWLGPRPVKLCLSDDQIRKITLDSINSIPYSTGVNIHMGALASENERVVSDVMKAVKEKGLYFVDSVTSHRTVCRSVGQKLGARFIERNVFLECPPDNKTKSYIKKQLAIAGNLAKKKGYAVVIGHVGSAGGKVTAESIKEMIPELESKGIEFVFVSELLK